jgi:hypothetical protein
LFDKLDQMRAREAVVPDRAMIRHKSSSIAGAGNTQMQHPSTGSGPFDALRRSKRSFRWNIAAEGHEQAAATRRVEWEDITASGGGTADDE